MKFEQLQFANWFCTPLVKDSVRFLIIGGWAVNFHGHERPVTDLDLLVEFSEENWRRLTLVLEQTFKLTIRPFEELLQSSGPFRLAALKPAVDIVTRINGVSFDDAWSESIERIIDNTIFEDCRVLTLSKSHLILSKKGSDRPIDATDIEAL